MYLIRLDDASEYMDVARWRAVRNILKKYDVKPIIGVIPNDCDSGHVTAYKRNNDFWDTLKQWEKEGSRVALHGNTHQLFDSKGGINPVNKRTEFVGLSLEHQKKIIREGYFALKAKGFFPDIFFAPAHTFDQNTLEALETETSIRIISDTIANDIYKEGAFYFIPQQTGHPLSLPFRVVTICLHPNIMEDKDFACLEKFIRRHKHKFLSAGELRMKDRKINAYDKALRLLYFTVRKIRGL